jgi:transcriptional regulator with XRE-family HTH domain
MTFLEYARRSKGWTQKQLGDHPAVRISQTFLSQCERGTGLPVPEQRARLARVLDIPPEKLLDQVPDDILNAPAEESSARA